MLEAYTTLGFLAAHTERVRLHALVTASSTAIPACSRSWSRRSTCSRAAARASASARPGTRRSRGARLAASRSIARAVRAARGDACGSASRCGATATAPFEGEHYQLARTLNSPQSLSRPQPYLMIGGSGERKTLRLVAQHADACNIFSRPEAAHKLDVLRAHCEREGRDYDAIEKTTILSIDPAATKDDVLALLGRRATPASRWPTSSARTRSRRRRSSSSPQSCPRSPAGEAGRAVGCAARTAASGMR